MKQSSAAVLRRLQAIAVADVCMSVVSKSALLYGVDVSPRRAQDAAALASFLPDVEALDVPDVGATLSDSWFGTARSRTSYSY